MPMTIDNFKHVKESVDIVEAAQRYGLMVDRNKKSICPFHSDTKPSLSFKGNYYTCFSCGAKGSVIDLTQKLLNLEKPIDALKQLNNDFNLNMEFTRAADPVSAVKISDAEKEKLKVVLDELNQWCDQKYIEYEKRLSDYMEYVAKLEPAKTDEERESRYLESVKFINITQFRMDILKNGSVSDKFELQKLLNKIEGGDGIDRKHSRL